ncbi:MAG: zinc ribbon domain-containing protein [Treponema sp.]|jgi:uncharacterized membrane protein YvbJ|nr:zinc ribbon domain-containing protein [Treponema sp.]
MALINCPECQKEISNKVKSCPHCGYPFENNESAQAQKVEITDIKVNSTKVKPIITGIVATVAIAFVIFFAIKYITKSFYISKLKIIHEEILESATLAEGLTTLTHDVWANAIRKTPNPNTNRYTRHQGG